MEVRKWRGCACLVIQSCPNLCDPMDILNKENISDKLEERNIEQSLIDKFMNCLNDCEFARYAPGDPAETMDKTFQEASDVISEMENIIKKRK